MAPRRGSALILVLLMTLAVAGLAIAAIFMSSSAGLLSRFYDREREFRLAAESALELATVRLMRDTALAIPDTGMRQLYAGLTISDADGVTVPRVSVNVFAAHTGDTTGLFVPHVTLLAVAYDANGTRHVRRSDLRRESFSRYHLFADSFPAGVTHGPGTVNGRVHTNGTWRGSASGNVYRDTVSALTAVTGTGTYEVDSVVGGPRVRYPRDSTYSWMHTYATASSHDVTPVSAGSRVEFVAFDADANGTVSADEGYVRVFDLLDASRADTTRLRVSPPQAELLGIPLGYYSWSDDIVQNQCGAFYHIGTRWHFIPVATHRSARVRTMLRPPGPSVTPNISNAVMNVFEQYSLNATATILEQPMARCFPAGSPYLVMTERFTNAAAVVTNSVADIYPWGERVPGAGWPASAPEGYGGSDTTFTVNARTCRFSTVTAPASYGCASGFRALGSWRSFSAATPASTASATVRQALELPYLRRLTGNSASRGVLSANSGPVYLSGTARGAVTLRVNGRVTLVDRLTMYTEPNDPMSTACADQLGVVAVGDILVVEGLTSRVRRISQFLATARDIRAGGAAGFQLQGALMSLTGAVGVESPTTTVGAAGFAMPCPDGAAASTATNGGCWALTGSAIMQRYDPLYGATANSGFRYFGNPDRCQQTTRRPPFFPLTNRYTKVRTLEVEPSQANSPTKIRALLMRLKGKTL